MRQRTQPTLHIHPAVALQIALATKRSDRAKAEALLQWMATDPNATWTVARLLDLFHYLNDAHMLPPRGENNHDYSPAIVAVLDMARRQRWESDTWREIFAAEMLLGRLRKELHS